MAPSFPKRRESMLDVDRLQEAFSSVSEEIASAETEKEAIEALPPRQPMRRPSVKTAGLPIGTGGRWAQAA